MKYTFTFLLLFSAFAVADVKINETAGATCHIPASQTNGGNEYKTPCKPSNVGIREFGDGTTASGQLIFDVNEAMYGVFPGLNTTNTLETVIHYNGREGFLRFDGSEGVPCNLVNDDGTTFTTNDWTARIEIIDWRPGEAARQPFKAHVKIACRNATAN
ncbi:MAG: hypothetical protein DBP02_02130 [gamma proteobacterium symbiont of Ctena orbiculata]|nr:MAG: hypothetical protein DBP02_02130 [gamma proteobacterium symbiont of Ctena orbiculata]